MSHRTDRDPSDSGVQREIERDMLDWLNERHPDWHPVEWASVASDLGLPPAWKKAKPDAVWKLADGRIAVAECYARVDYLKTGHRRKLAMDAFKLLSLRDAVTDPNRLRCLLIVPEELDQQLQTDGWLPLAILKAAEVIAVRLTDGQRQKLREAVERQAAGQARTRKSGRGR